MKNISVELLHVCFLIIKKPHRGNLKWLKSHILGTIISDTDKKGIITAANDVFQEVAGYSESELVGANHNIVRHDDMPRAAFKLVWDTIASGKRNSCLCY